MRSVVIEFDRRRVLPGEILSGSVRIVTDEAFDCNRVVLKLKSRERTETGSGKHRRVDTKTLLSRVFRISEGRTIPEGTTLVPFTFKVPKGLPPSYKGYRGEIKHEIEAVVEVNWALDPKSKQQYRVLQYRPPYIQAVGDTKVVSKSNDVLDIRLDETILRLDSGIRVHFKFGQKKRIKRVRFDIKKREERKCGWSTSTHESNVVQKYFDIREDDWGRWHETSIGENWNCHLPFTSQLFQVGYYLQVTLEIGWEIDPSIRIPLRFSDVKPKEQDVLDEIADDLGIEW